MHRAQLANTEFFLTVGDITDHVSDAIVNAANSKLDGGGGVDGAIHERGGPSILEECRLLVQKQGECHPGNAVITSAGALPAEYVIHTVGPVWQGGTAGEEEVLRRCYLTSLQLAQENNVKTLAFPSIGTGAFKVPIDVAALIAQKTVIDYILKHRTFKEVGFVLYDQMTYEHYFNEFEKLFSS